MLFRSKKKMQILVIQLNTLSKSGAVVEADSGNQNPPPVGPVRASSEKIGERRFTFAILPSPACVA